VVSGLTVMIASPHQPFGVLAAMATSRRAFASADVSFVQAVANVLAGAVDRSRAQQRLADAREAERRRLARDLHDEALRELAEAVVLAGATDAVGDPATASARLNRLLPVLTAVGEHLRNVINDLRAADDGKATFTELAQELVAVHRTLAPGAEVELELGDGPLSGALGATGNEVLRILGEALANVRRHAGAEHVRVRVSAAGGELRAEVRDDGSGFDVATSAHGTGLKGMRERAELLHGILDVGGTPGTGTTVVLTVPLRGVGADPAPPTPGQARVLLVDDHAAVREALAAAFAHDAGFAIAGQASSLAEARELLDDVDVAVLDLALPDGFGADLIGELHRASPRAQALVLSATLDDAEVARAIEAGAAGVLNKVAALGGVVDAVRRLQAGQTLMPLGEVAAVLRAAGDRRAREHDDRCAIAQLTPREREVLQALAEGLDTEQLADRLHISVRTERNHIANILAKLGVHSRLQALVFALRYGIVEIR
jgi:DNA-binding NarL/FixJ family response regulator